MNMIEIHHVTKDYGNNKGIFDVNLSVKEGEVFGFLGPNGAGKTTTIRNLMGFIRPDHGSCSIMRMDCFKDAPSIQEKLGYLAGEIAFLEDMSGKKLLDFIADMKGIKDRTRIKELMERFELDPRGKVKKMSKGMKQKVGIICAFMGNPDILILDEPTSGLDPLMQNRFIELILEEKKKGKTIFMSSHIFEEIEKTCDRAAIIREGRIIAIENIEELKNKKSKKYILTFPNSEIANTFTLQGFKILKRKGSEVMVSVGKNVSDFIKQIAKYPIEDMNIQTQTLEEIFLHFYGGGKA